MGERKDVDRCSSSLQEFETTLRHHEISGKMKYAIVKSSKAFRTPLLGMYVR